MRILSVSCLLLSAFLPLGAGRARADLVDYSYHWGISPGAVITGTNPSRSTGSEQSSGSVAFALTPDGTGTATLGGGASTIPAATVTTTSSATEQGPDSFASPFSLTLRLTDLASGASGDLTFAAAVNGSLTATTSTLTANFDGPLTQQVTLGGHRYAVTIDPSSVHIPEPGASAPALVDAFVVVSAGGEPPPPISQAPEPSGLLLAVGALPVAAFTWRRRSRAR